MALLQCKALTLAYDSKPIVNSLSCSVSKGDYVCILGENGAGKSTFIKGILGLIKPSCGEIVYSEGLYKNKIGYLPQQSDIQRDFPASVFEVVLSGALNKNKFLPFYSNTQKKEALKNMELMGISNLKKACFQELSGGQQQRVLLARAMCAASEMIVLDEPVSGLDPIVTSELYDIVNELNKKHSLTVIMVSHDLERALKNASHILHIENDDSFFGTVDEYLNSNYINRLIQKKG